MIFNTMASDCLYYLVYRASLTATSLMKKRFAESGVGNIRPAYLGVLLALWDSDGLKVTELGRKAGLEPSSMTGLIDRMERDGIIHREMDPNDRRALRIFLTQFGKTAQEPVMKVVEEALRFRLEDFSEEEMETTKNVLKRFIQKSELGKIR